MKNRYYQRRSPAHERRVLGCNDCRSLHIRCGITRDATWACSAQQTEALLNPARQASPRE